MLFFFNDTATTEIYTLSLHDALPIYARDVLAAHLGSVGLATTRPAFLLLVQLGLELLYPLLEAGSRLVVRSEEHTSELQSRQYLVCRLLLEKKKKIIYTRISSRSSLA